LPKTLLAVFVAIALLRGAPAWAQESPGGPDPANVRVRIGPLMMNPTIAVSNIGIDHNVFNDPPDKVPKEDFTVTITPLTDLWIRLGATWLSASLNESINWFKTYSSERTANNLYKLGWTVPGAHASLKVEGTYVNARERPGFEIDTRAARKETTFNGALDFHALPQTYIGVTASRQQTRFEEGTKYLEVELRDALNRVDISYGANLRHTLTPLTSVSVNLLRSNSKFEFSPDRDTSSTGVNALVTFEPAALIRGSATIGFTDFTPADPALPGYRGMVGGVDLVYVLLGSTRFAVSGGRGVQYSYDDAQPYYVQSRIGGSIAQQIFGPFDVQVRGDISYLAYRNRAGVPIEVPDRTDRVTTVGVGLGFHMGKDLRLAFNVDQNNRDTRKIEHQYEKFLIGTSLTYGF
jgi:hypothetical protein